VSFAYQRTERDACGIGFAADAEGRTSRAIVEAGLEALTRVRHRGALAADGKSGDGAGLLVPIPRRFVAGLVPAAADPGRLGLAFAFLDSEDDGPGRAAIESACRDEGIELLAWRDVPVDAEAIGDLARRTMPHLVQAILRAPSDDGEDAERRAYRARKRAETAGVPGRFYLPSLSFRTVTYKALSAADQLAAFYLDLQDESFEAPFAMFHQRYSTNTMPTWERAQPFRLLCHNGEINTIQGNVNLMRAREGRLGAGDLAPETLLSPVVDESGSDSSMLDNLIELLIRGGRSARHAMAMAVPEAWEGTPGVAQDVKAFYRYHAALLEPWDGPAGLVFTDGIGIGATLDRNGLRPLRYAICEDGLVACASEAGAVDVSGHGSVRRGKLGPGQTLWVAPGEGTFENHEIKRGLAATNPYGAWLDEHLMEASTGEPVEHAAPLLVERQVAHGYTKEEVTVVIRPMAIDAKETTSSMGDDTQQAVLAERPRTLQHFLKQRFAQVTNPPIDHLRERLVMSLSVRLGPRRPLLESAPEAAAVIELPSFLLTPEGLDSLVAHAPWPAATVDATFATGEGPEGLRAAIDRVGEEAERAVREGAGLVVVSDFGVDPGRAPIPAVLAIGAAHHRLVRAGLRTLASLIAATDEPHDVHGVACLLGYGAEAVVPRLVLDTIAELCLEKRMGGDSPAPDVAQARFREAIEDGVLKVMSKMGICTVESYRSAQIFEAIGLGPEVIATCLTGTPSPLGGIGFAEIGADVLARHGEAFAPKPALTNPGFIKHRAGGDYHMNNPEVVASLHGFVGVDAAAEAEEDEAGAEGADGHVVPAIAHTLQRAVKADDYAGYERFAELVNDRPPAEPRDLLELVPGTEPIPLDDVEPALAITRRFSTGAMSHGALSAEAHETLSVALNLIGGKANTGEGGEDRARYRDQRNSRIKQVASGRFGVTPEYLAFAEELQIKMAQGSKPGEGGQLPGNKVTHEIATLRHTTPGVALISPPPHHDIYSIEDLAQLIFDLKQVNPKADISVKLVSTDGVGTIAAGVAKGLAEVVHIAGADGGTGASPLSSIKNAGLSWEIGLAETQRTLVDDGLRSRIRVRVDGGFKTGRDVIVAALLGADEYSFGTAALLAEGCIMVRTCHRDTCPVGIASQRPELRAKFPGTPEMVANYLLFVAEETRRLLASLGLRSLDEAIGRVDLLRPRTTGNPRADALDVRSLIAPPTTDGARRFESTVPLQDIRSDLGDRVAAEALPALREGHVLGLSYAITNGDRSVGARLGGDLALEFGDGRAPGRVRVSFEGQAGQSFGAFLPDGVEFHLVGEANDYVGKGLGGGRLVIEPPEGDAGDPFLVGNTVLYGATGGQLFVAGRAGERFAVRNSGAVAVIEGVGDHACEYMTGGAVVVLGSVGHNLAAGMTGGEVYVHDPDDLLHGRLNAQLVEARRPTAAQGPSLHRLVERHAKLTGSARAKALLADWEEAAPRFWRVVTKSEVAMLEAAFEGTLARA
jgi:glutamate synthase (ferredoxin)